MVEAPQGSLVTNEGTLESQRGAAAVASRHDSLRSKPLGKPGKGIGVSEEAGKPALGASIGANPAA